MARRSSSAVSGSSGTGDWLARTLHAAANAVPELVWVIDTEGRCLFANEAAARYLGGSPASLTGQLLLSAERLASYPFPATLEDLQAGQSVRQLRTQDKTGVWQVLDFQLSRLPAAEGEPSDSLLCIGRFITDLVEQHQRAEQGQDLLQKVATNAPLVVWIIGADGTFQLSTGMGLRALGLQDQQLVGTKIQDVFPEDVDSLASVQSILTGGQAQTWESSVRNGIRHRNYGSPVFNAAGEVTSCFGISIDVTERYVQETRLRDLAYVSQIMDLPSRARLVEWLVSAPQNSALIHFDVDHFRRINESFGRITGNELLRAAGVRLREALPSNIRLAHLGGDHFGVLMPETDAEQAQRMAQLALNAFRVSLMLSQGDFFCTLSAGIALRSATDSPDDWLNHAEIALHHAKDDGRNRCLMFRSEFIDHIREDTRIYLEMRQALDLGRLQVHYEPQISLLNRRVVGFEALTRWRHPALAAVPVGETIRVAEESGLIREITRQVLEQIHRDLVQWRSRLGPRLPVVSINVNSDEFVDPAFMGLLDSILSSDSGLAPFLRVELTESAMMANPAEARRVLIDLRKRGVLASLDDFGTGFSSLALLHELPVDELKIDRSLVPGVNNPVPASLVRTIMAMASLLRLRTTAEGIETPEQERLMTSLGCDHAQGFLYSRAMTSDAACDMAAAYPSPFTDHHPKGSP